MPSRSAAAVMMRMLAWCGIITRRPSTVRPLRASRSRQTSYILRTAYLKTCCAFLVDVVQPLVDGLVRGRQAAAAGGHFEEIAARAIHLAQEIDETAAVLAIARPVRAAWRRRRRRTGRRWRGRCSR